MSPIEGKELSLSHANHQEKCIMSENQIREMKCGRASPGGGERAGGFWGHKSSLVPRHQMELRVRLCYGVLRGWPAMTTTTVITNK